MIQLISYSHATYVQQESSETCPLATTSNAKLTSIEKLRARHVIKLYCLITPCNGA